MIERAWLRVDGRVRSLFKYGFAALAASLVTVWSIGEGSPGNVLILVGESCALIGGLVGYLAGSDRREKVEQV